MGTDSEGKGELLKMFYILSWVVVELIFVHVKMYQPL